MTSKEALEELKDEIIPDCALEYEDDEGYKDWVMELYNTIKQDLERLEEIEKEYDNLKKDYDNKDLECIDLYKENQELKDYTKALDKACEILWDCPVSQELVDDLDCENCNDNYKECWKKYFLKEVLED